MGRSLLRKMERQQRADKKQNGKYMSREEIQKLKNEIKTEVSFASVEILLTSFAQVLHNEYGFGQKRVLRALNAVDEIYGRVLNDELSVADMRQQLRDDINVTIMFDRERSQEWLK